MAYDEGLAERLRELLLEQEGIREKRMFGGIVFLLNGNMCVGVVNDVLMVRVGPQAYASLLSEPYVRPMDFTGKPLKGFIYVDPEGIDDDQDLQTWVEHGLRFTASLPVK